MRRSSSGGLCNQASSSTSISVSPLLNRCIGCGYLEYLFGIRAITPFRLLWIIAIPIGANSNLSFIWLVADTLNALMALPNLLALLLLSPVVFSLTRDHFRSAG